MQGKHYPKSPVGQLISGKLYGENIWFSKDGTFTAGSSFQSGQVGLYVNDTGFRLIADNLIIDKIEGK